MINSLSEKAFFLENDHEVNKLVFRIGWIFMGVLTGILAAAYFDIFKVAAYEVLHIMCILLLIEAVFYILLRADVSATVIKYYGLLAMEACVLLMIANAYFGVYISYVLVPVISCLYFDNKLTRNITVICFIGMLVALWFRAPGAILLAYPGYTRLSWYIAFGLGYTLEYAALSAVLIAVSKRSLRYMKELYHRNEKISDIQNKIIYRFADLVESRDDSTGKHVKRTSKYVVMLAKRLCGDGPYRGCLGDEDIVNIEMAAPLHDIGKIIIPDSILKKPGKLTPDEFDIIKTHTTEGYKIVDSAMDGIEGDAFLSVARDIALSHHEKWDGSGYPAGLSGDQIPLSARIMAVADVFDALVSDRCYKKAVPVEEAFKVLTDGKGTHFDPYIVDVFIASETEIRQICLI